MMSDGPPPATGWWVWTSCSIQARKLSELSGLAVYAEVESTTTTGRRSWRYWYPGEAAQVLQTARSVGREERCYAVLHEAGAELRTFAAALRTAVAVGGVAAARALFDQSWRG